MTNFDDLVINTSSAFMGALSTSKTGTYFPKGRPKIENITVMYDKQVFEPDPLGDRLVERDPRITIETAQLLEESRQGDRIEFDGITVKVEHNEGDEMGLTSLGVRDITSEY